MTLRTCEPSTIVIFGGTGDLSHRKLLPALARLDAEKALHPKTHILAVGRSAERDDAWFKKEASASLAKAGHARSPLIERLGYQPAAETEDYVGLAQRIERIEREAGIPQNRTFYFALPPEAFKATIEGLGSAGLHQAKGYARLVLEKPFGHDLSTARELNAFVHRYFDEQQIYRIDHYLGKDPVQNLLVFRFGNAFLEALWNRKHIDAVQITASETLGVGTRAGYYDTSGALRDMVQNHLTQLMTLVAMEPPVSFNAESIREEKIKVLRSLAPIGKGDAVRGQYTAGEAEGKKLPGYLETDGVPKDSTTETFVALRLQIDNWRWQGVPFYLRTGKALAGRSTQIAIRFQRSPVGLFKSAGVDMDTEDVLLIALQPNEGFSLHLDVKVPGSPFRLQRIPLAFRYGDQFASMPDAYQTLLHDVLSGDQTLFVHADEVEHSWRVYSPILDAKDKPFPYPAGSWGPAQADELAIAEKELWTG